MNLAATDETLLLLLVFFGLYLADCVVLLHPGQAIARIAVVRHKRKGEDPKTQGLGIGQRCRVDLDFGMTFFPVRGRYLAVLNPLTPFVTVFKTRQIDGGASVSAESRPIDLRRIVAIRIRTARMNAALIAHGLLLFVILPLLLLGGETERLLIALGAAFLSAALILTVCYFDRRATRLPMTGFWTAAGSALLCLPVSLNAPRKLALLASAEATAPELLSLVPIAVRQAPLDELRLTLDRAAVEGSEAADAVRRRLAIDYPET